MTLLARYPFIVGCLVGLLAAIVSGAIAWKLRRGRSAEERRTLQDRERQLRTLVGNLPGVAFRCHPYPGYAFEFASDGVADVLGYTQQELGPNGLIRFSDLVHPDDRHRLAMAVTSALEAGERFTATFRIIHRDGSIRWLWDRGIGVYDARGKPIAIEGFAADITEQRRVEEERARLLDETQRALTSREDFLSMAMHDIRSPLTALKLHVQANLRRMTMAPSFGAEDMEKALHKIDGQVERMRLLVDDLLDVTRASAGHLEMRMEEMDLAALVREIVKRHQAQLDTAHCEVRLDCDDRIMGRWDWLRLEQVLTNLLSNAVKYANGKPIEVIAHLEGPIARLEVRDHGPGLSTDDRERLFQRYERLSASHRASSSGLGLWIVRTIVQALGGTVECFSDGPGLGTSFVVCLPLEPAPMAPTGEVTPLPTATPREASLV